MKQLRVDSEDLQKVTVRIDADVYKYAKSVATERDMSIALFIQECIKWYRSNDHRIL